MTTKPQLRLLLLTLLSFGISSFLYGKTDPRPDAKFGKVSLEELKMTHYEHDSSASAVILFNVGKFTDSDITFRRHMRIKILNKAGLSWANQTFNTPSKGNFKVVVSNLENNEIVTEKAKSESIFEEEIFDDYQIYKVFAPSVKVGSVIDIFYSFIGLPSEWRFQDIIPVKYSELEIESSKLISYNKFSFGFEPIETFGINRWRSTDVPAFKIEPFLTSYTNYITKFRIQVTSINFYGPNTRIVDFSSTWGKVAGNLDGSSKFGSVIDGNRYLKDVADSIQSLNLTPIEKASAALNYIKENIKWDKSNRAFASFDYKEKLTKFHTGNSADINLQLIGLLKRLDLEAYPVALSTRDNGVLLEYQPAIDQINYVIAYIKFDSDQYLLADATSEESALGVLPVRCINGKGLLIGDEKYNWIPLKSSYTYDKRQFSMLNLSADLELTGQMSVNHKGLEFTSWCEAQDRLDEDSEKYINWIKEEFDLEGIMDHSISAKNVDKQSVTEKFKLDLESKLIDNGNSVIIFPIVMYDYDKNPLKSDVRSYPLDLTSTKNYSYTTILNLPQGAEIVNSPTSVKFMNSDASANFQYLINKTAAGLQLQIDLTIDKPIFIETEYNELKEFFSQVSKAVNQPIEIVL